MRFMRSPRCSGQRPSGTLVTMSSCVTGAECSRMKVFCSGFLPARGPVLQGDFPLCYACS
jgi:hypothetical protein